MEMRIKSFLNKVAFDKSTPELLTRAKVAFADADQVSTTFVADRNTCTLTVVKGKKTFVGKLYSTGRVESSAA